MAWNFQKNEVTGKSEIVISGFENGIDDSPYTGIADMRNINILTAPKQGSVAFATSAVTLPPTGFTAVAFTATASTDLITTASTAGFYNGMALTIVSLSGGGSGLTVNLTYYVGDITSTTFKLYSVIGLNTLVDITLDISGTFTVHTFGTPTDSVTSTGAFIDSVTGLPGKYTFVMTSEGYVWYLTPIINIGIGGTIPVNTLQFLGNTSPSTPGTITQTGIVVWKGYLFAFMNAKIDYISISNITSGNPSNLWILAWQTITSSSQGHRAIAATDDALYFCNNTKVGSLLQNAGSTFDPATSATYTYNASALSLPTYDQATCLSQLGVNLLVGGVLNYIYPWDRVSTSFFYPLVLPENFTKCIVSTNSSGYIFAGNRGYIYITNGANIQVFKKMPDALSSTVDPYYSWGWAVYQKDQLFFTISATNNSSTVISNYAGIWSIDLTASLYGISQGVALRMSNSLSYGSYAGTVPVLVPMGEIYPTGDGLYAGWVNSTGGIDFTSGSPYTNYEARIDTDIIPVGTFLMQKNFTSVEFKLSKPMVSGESIKLSWRSDLTSAFTLLGTTTTAVLSDVYIPNFSNIQWLQMRAEISSTATTPSYVPLMEIRLRM